jgi:hypothetical protein
MLLATLPFFWNNEEFVHETKLIRYFYYFTGLIFLLELLTYNDYELIGIYTSNIVIYIYIIYGHLLLIVMKVRLRKIIHLIIMVPLLITTMIFTLFDRSITKVIVIDNEHTVVIGTGTPMSEGDYFKIYQSEYLILEKLIYEDHYLPFEMESVEVLAFKRNDKSLYGEFTIRFYAFKDSLTQKEYIVNRQWR